MYNQMWTQHTLQTKHNGKMENSDLNNHKKHDGLSIKTLYKGEIKVIMSQDCV